MQQATVNLSVNDMQHTRDMIIERLEKLVNDEQDQNVSANNSDISATQPDDANIDAVEPSVLSDAEVRTIYRALYGS